MRAKLDVILLASNINPGETVRLQCPSCGGGSSRENSLTITRELDNSLVWNCFRDKCTEKGNSGDSSYIHTPTVEAVKPRKRFEGRTEPLSEHRLRIIEKKWGIVDPPHWYWTPDYGGRVAMSVRSPKYMHRGWVLRDLRGVARAKALTYLDEEEVALSWYKTQKDAPTVIVEDIPSAVRVSMCGVNAVALLGTIVNTDKAVELKDHASSPIVIALDQDATAKSFRIALNYKLLWEDVRVLPLKKDFKDMTDGEANDLLSSVCKL